MNKNYLHPFDPLFSSTSMFGIMEEKERKGIEWKRKENKWKERKGEVEELSLPYLLSSNGNEGRLPFFCLISPKKRMEMYVICSGTHKNFFPSLLFLSIQEGEVLWKCHPSESFLFHQQMLAKQRIKSLPLPLSFPFPPKNAYQTKPTFFRSGGAIVLIYCC